MKVKCHPRSVGAIAARLRATREAFGLADHEFSRRAGIEKVTYRQYELAKHQPHLEQSMQICDVYGVTLNWIYRGDISGLPFHIANILASMAAPAVERG